MPRIPFKPRPGAEQRLDAELTFHIEQRVADLIGQGLSLEAARAQARREFGGVEQVKEACRDERSTRWISDTLRDLRIAVRALRRAPVFTVVGVLTLTLGIGANVAVFQVLDALSLRPLPVPAAHELRQIRVDHRGEGRSGNFRGRSADLTAAQVAVLERDLAEVDGLAVWTNLQFNLADAGEVRMADGLRVNGDYFRVLGVTALQGRLLGAADDTMACDTNAVVIGERFWERSLGRQPDVLGQPLHLDGHRFEIVGVLPAHFFGAEVGRTIDVAVPLCTERTMTIGRNMYDIKSGWWLGAMARLPTGMSDEQFAARLDAMAPGVFRETLPDEYRPELAQRYLAFSFEVLDAGTGVSPLRSRFSGPLALLGAITAIVLLIACANLANLLLARASHRERELAIRLAIGASRSRLVRYSASEAVILTMAGTALGTLLAMSLSRGLVEALNSRSSPVYLNLEMNWALLTFVAGIAALTAALCAIAPALRCSHVPAAAALRDGLRASSSSRTLSWRRVLIVGEVALTFVLLVGALLFARSLGNLRSVDVGFNPIGLVEVRAELGRLPDWQARRPAVRDAILERLAARPWVSSFAEVDYLPIGGSTWNDNIAVEGLTRTDIQSQLNRVGVGYFATLGVALVDGRGFTSDDRLDAPKVAVVNRTFRDRYMDGTPVVGRRVRFLSEPDESYEVVGVVGDTKYASIREENPAIVFVSAAQAVEPPPVIPLLVRSTTGPDATIAALGRELTDVSPDLVFRTRVLSTLIDDTLRMDRLLATLSMAFGALAVLLAGVGLYGVIAYIAAPREHEIGIRLALGATRHHVVARVVRDTAWLVAGGIGLGLVGAVLAGRAVESLLFGLEASDMWSYVLALAVLTTIGLAASVLPAWRASKTSPMQALRNA